MEKENKAQSKGKIRGFLGRLFEKIDKKMEEKAKSGSCCCKPAEEKNKSCCS